MDAERRRAIELRDERFERVPAHSLGEIVANVDIEAARGGERLHRLDAADIRAREQALDRERLEQCGDPLRLATAPAVERTEAVVALPAHAIAGRRVADDE